MKKVFLTILVGIVMAGLVYSAPVDLPLGSKELMGKKWSYEENTKQTEISLGLELDFISKIELSDGGELEANFYNTKITFSAADNIDFYINIGQANDVSYKVGILGSNVEFNLDGATMYGLGISGNIPFKEDLMNLSIDLKYRTISGMDYKSIVLDGVSYSKASLGGSAEADWSELQLAVAASKKIDCFMPYAGIKFSSVGVSAKATILGIEYDSGTFDNDNKIGVFAGISITPTDQMSIDLQGRFIDEQAIMLSFVYKF